MVCKIILFTSYHVRGQHSLVLWISNCTPQPIKPNKNQKRRNYITIFVILSMVVMLIIILSLYYTVTNSITAKFLLVIIFLIIIILYNTLLIKSIPDRCLQVTHIYLIGGCHVQKPSSSSLLFTWTKKSCDKNITGCNYIIISEVHFSFSFESLKEKFSLVFVF